VETRALKVANRILFSRCWVASNFISRLMGLMCRMELSDDEAVVFPRCNSIHTCFMYFPIDVVFVAQNGEVLEVLESLRPWRFLIPRRKARHAIEMGSGVAARKGICLGMQLKCEGVF